MLHHSGTYAAHQRARWMRPDAARFLRPDAAKPLKGGANFAAVSLALADQRIVLEGLRCHLSQIKSDLAWRRLRDAIDRKYSDSQPRVPAGETGGGQWTSGSGSSG